MLTFLNFLIVIINGYSWKKIFVSEFVVFMLSGTSKVTFLWTGCSKGCTPPCVCLCDEGLSEKSRLVGFVFCSLYTSSQLRDKTDKSTPFPPPPHLPLLVSSFSVLLFTISFFPHPFNTLCWGWLSDGKWPSMEVNFLTTSIPPLQQSHKPKDTFSALSKCTFYTWGLNTTKGAS